jgi:hypothetical protein
MEFMRRPASCIPWNHKQNENILEKLKIQPIFKFIDLITCKITRKKKGEHHQNRLTAHKPRGREV